MRNHSYHEFSMFVLCLPYRGLSRGQEVQETTVSTASVINWKVLSVCYSLPNAPEGTSKISEHWPRAAIGRGCAPLNFAVNNGCIIYSIRAAWWPWAMRSARKMLSISGCVADVKNRNNLYTNWILAHNCTW